MCNSRSTIKKKISYIKNCIIRSSKFATRLRCDAWLAQSNPVKLVSVCVYAKASFKEPVLPTWQPSSLASTRENNRVLAWLLWGPPRSDYNNSYVNSNANEFNVHDITSNSQRRKRILKNRISTGGNFVWFEYLKIKREIHLIMMNDATKLRFRYKLGKLKRNSFWHSISNWWEYVYSKLTIFNEICICDLQ